MRPAILNSLFRSVDSLPGIGPRNRQLLTKLAGERVIDLLKHVPHACIDRRDRPTIAGAMAGAVVTLKIRVTMHKPPTARNRPARVVVKDDTGEMDLVYFHAKGDWLNRILPVNSERLISGKIERFNERAQMVHPDYVEPLENEAAIPLMEPIYPLTQGLNNATVIKSVAAALKQLPALPEWLDPALKAQREWPGWVEAIKNLHQPDTPQHLEMTGPSWQRLAYDELLANQLALAIVREKQKRVGGVAIAGTGDLRERAVAALPFALTGSQEQALQEIYADQAQPHRMARLLQGDVGSGKTVIALLTMLNAIECGQQAVMMAPTEILARQHFAGLVELARALNVRLELLTGRDKGRSRTALLEDLKAGRINILVGTHAVFQDDVDYADLGLVVVDEQHRFGVQQRLTLARKGQGVDVLVMTATPIPRTLTMTAFGDMEVSRLTEKPPGRQPVDTRVLPDERLQDVVQAVGRKIAEGARVYWVCPLVEESETVDLAAAEDRHAALKSIFGERVGLVHGRLRGPDKDKVMADFAEGRIDILVATTVIEVGVNVPEATVMVIEHAERFGLAQLHQLRGRIGRGQGASTCLLIYSQPLSESGRARLEILRETEDGFRIAEEDLRLRGAGDVLGTQQSGLPQFSLADLAAHQDLMEIAASDARLIVQKDLDLENERGQALRVLLYLFAHDESIQLRVA